MAEEVEIAGADIKWSILHSRVDNAVVLWTVTVHSARMDIVGVDNDEVIFRELATLYICIQS